MTFTERVQWLTQTAHTNHVLLSDSMLEEVFPAVKKAMDEKAGEIGYDGWKWNQSDDTPPGFHGLMFEEIIRPVVLTYLEENHKEAWFKTMYLPVHERREIMDGDK